MSKIEGIEMNWYLGAVPWSHNDVTTLNGHVYFELNKETAVEWF